MGAGQQSRICTGKNLIKTKDLLSFFVVSISSEFLALQSDDYGIIINTVYKYSICARES